MNSFTECTCSVPLSNTVHFSYIPRLPYSHLIPLMHHQIPHYLHNASLNHLLGIGSNRVASNTEKLPSPTY